MVVGKDKFVYHVHKKLLMEKSPFFQACLSSGMVEQQTNEVVLPQDLWLAFDFVVNWIYSDKIKRLPLTLESAMAATKAWVLADKLCMPKLQNVLMDRIRELWRDDPMHPFFLLWTARNTTDESPIHRFIMDQLSHDMVHASDFYNATEPTEAKSLPKSLGTLMADPDISLKLLWQTNKMARGQRAPAKLKGCHYHVHKDGEACGLEQR